VFFFSIMLPWLLFSLALLASLALTLRLSRVIEKRENRGWPFRWPIPRVHPRELDPVFATTDLGPTLDTLVHYSSSIDVQGGTSDREAWILAVLAKRSHTIFEFGTCTGKTAHLLALNAPDASTIHTITLAPDQAASYVKAAEDEGHETKAALRASVHTSFVYTNTPVAHKVRQYFGDSKAFDVAPLANTCDLIFVDGSHTASYVRSDSEKALAMLAPGGIIIWHDYRGPWRPRGVYKVLNQLASRLPLVHIQGTSFVAYRKPPS
jgi:predicted O-methyltransferase YrrM